jgi:hypothetical protein
MSRAIRQGEQGARSQAAEECRLRAGREIDGAFQPLSTTIVQTIAEFADAHMVRIWGTRRGKPCRR